MCGPLIEAVKPLECPSRAVPSFDYGDTERKMSTFYCQAAFCQAGLRVTDLTRKPSMAGFLSWNVRWVGPDVPHVSRSSVNVLKPVGFRLPLAAFCLATKQPKGGGVASTYRRGKNPRTSDEDMQDPPLTHTHV